MGRTAASPATIRASVLAPLVRLLDEEGGHTDVLLAKHGLRRAQLTDPSGRIPLERYVTFFETSAEVLREPTLGLRLGSGMRPADLGPLGLLFAASATIRDALSTLSRSVAALQTGTMAALLEENEYGAFVYRIDRPPAGPRIQDTDFTLAAMLALVRTLAGPRWRPVEVRLDHPEPADIGPYRAVFGPDIRFGRPVASLVLSRTDLDRKFQDVDQELVGILTRYVGDLASENARPGLLADRVRGVIWMRIHQDKLTVDRLARELGMSVRSLQRRLEREGTSLRKLLREERQGIATAWLTSSSEPNGAISSALGYADGTVFWRAFKTWTGRTPSAFRR